MTEAEAQPAAPACPCCNGPMQLVQHIDLKGVPEIWVFYCSPCQYVETIKKQRAA